MAKYIIDVDNTKALEKLREVTNRAAECDTLLSALEEKIRALEAAAREASEELECGGERVTE